MSSDDLPPVDRRTLDYRNPRPDPKPAPLGYARYAPRPTPMPNPLAAFALMLAFFNVLWTLLSVAVLLSSDLAVVAWLLPPGVVVSSLSGFLMSLRARHDGLRATGLFLSAGCFIISGFALTLAIVFR